MAEGEIERLKEELQPQKDWDDQLQAQANWCLKEKTKNFEKLYLEHKELEKEYDPVVG